MGEFGLGIKLEMLDLGNAGYFIELGLGVSNGPLHVEFFIRLNRGLNLTITRNCKSFRYARDGQRHWLAN